MDGAVVAQLLPPFDEQLDYSASMTRLLGATAIVVVSVLSAALSGCASEPETIATPSATPTPTLTVEPALRPNSVFAINCAELLTLDEVQSRVTAPVSVQRDESNVSAAYWELESYQRGGLSCRWGGENRTDSSFDDGVDVLLLPEAGADFAARTSGGSTTLVDVAGAVTAFSQCGFGSELVDGAAPGYCTVWALVGTSLAELRFSDSQGAYPTQQAIGAVAIGLLETAIERMVAAGTREQEWTPPATSLEADSAFCTPAKEALLGALGMTTEFGGAEPADAYPGVTSCKYYFGATDVHGVAIFVVADAAWVARVPHTEAPAQGQPFEPRTTTNGGTWWLSPSGESVRGRAAVAGSLIEVVVYWMDIDVTVEQAQAAITAFMEEYAEVPPGS